MRKLTLAIIVVGSLLGLGGFAAQQTIGYDQSAKTVCLYNKAASPNCLPFARYNSNSGEYWSLHGGAYLPSWVIKQLSGTVTWDAVNAISPPSTTGSRSALLSASRTSDNLITTEVHNVTTDTAYSYHDNMRIGHYSWARFTAADIKAGSIPSLVIGEENSVRNHDGTGASGVKTDPFSFANGGNPKGTSEGLRLGTGWGVVGDTVYDISSYLHLAYNGAKAKTGILFSSNALDISNGYADAIAMAPHHGITWYNSKSTVGWKINRPTNAGSGQISLGNNTFDIYLNTNGTASHPIAANTTSVSIAGHQFPSAASPTLSSCGTGATVANHSNSSGGRITTGTGTVRACTVKFATAYSNTSFCAVTPSNSSGATYYVSEQTATGFTLTFGSSVPSTSWQYVCSGT